MPFIIKASYEGNTRRWTQQSDVFPSYQSLSDQIHKIFKNVDNFYLTRVTFSPSAADAHPSPSQFVLIASAVHSADEWTNTAAAPFLGVSYPTGMLKFIVNDNLVHKEVPSRNSGGPWANFMDVDVEPRFPIPPLPRMMPLRGFTVPIPQAPPIPHFAPIPPPPMGGPPPFVPFMAPPPPPPPHGPTGPPPPPGPPPMPTLRSVGSMASFSSNSSCCSVSSAKGEVKGMMESFLKEFSKTMADNFGDVDGGEAMDTSSPIQPDRTPLAPNRPLSPEGNIPGAFNAPTSAAEAVVHPNVMCDHCDKTVKGIRYKCNECPDFDLCEACMGENNNGGVIHNVSLDKNHTFKAIPKPVGTAAPAPLAIHNAFCDVCRKSIVGSRHKCLDCPDYDMCDKCIVTQREKHDADHEFYEFKEPGRIVIHNVTRPFPHGPHPHRGHPFGHHGGPGFRGGRPFRGRGGHGGPFGRPHPHHHHHHHEEHGPLNRDAPDLTVPPVGVRPQPVVHNATCDLCDSKICGNRYKCSMCPDYDVCEGCFSIVAEQHPKHAFVRIKDPRDVMVRSHHYANRTVHHARCDSCGKQIVGARFKCTHRDCPDFDLCENCEALPIEAHPSSHALIKLRQPISFYEGLAGVLDYAKATKQKQAEMMDVARTKGASPEPSVTIWQPTVIRHVAEAAAATPELPIVVPQEKVEMPLPSPSNPWHAEPIVQPTPEAVVLEGEGEKEMVQMPLPIRPRPAPIVVASPDGKLVELARAMSIESASVVSTPSTLKSELAEEEEEVIAVVVPVEASVAQSNESVSPFADVHQVEASVVERAPSVISLASSQSSVKSAAPSESSVKSAPRPSATFVADLTIPDGHVLPPGAFFVKSWKMLNDGEVPWPAGTRLAFTGGERFGADVERLLVAGLTPPGEMTEIRVEFRAPEVPGKYASHWRLQDEEGRLFGHRIWCDVEVVDEAKVLNANASSGESSLSSSSLVIMPAAVVPADVVPAMVSPVQEPLPTPTLSSFDGASEAGSQTDDDVFSVADSDFQWEEASRPQSPDQFVMVYESSNDASDDDDN